MCDTKWIIISGVVCAVATAGDYGRNITDKNGNTVKSNLELCCVKDKMPFNLNALVHK